MAKDILSQSEIDSLISALTSGSLGEEARTEGDEKELRVYDFRRPSKFSKEQLRTLQIIHENFARILSNFLTAYLRVPVQIQVVSVSQVTYEEFIFSLTVPTLVSVFSMSPEMGSAMLETNPQFVFPMIDLIFGGTGEAPEHIRELTEIEISVMKQLDNRILENLRYVWEDLVTLQPKIESMETNPQFNQMIASTEAVILITFSTKVKDNEGLMNLCIPYITLENVIPSLTSQYWFTQVAQTATPEDSKNMENLLGKAEVQLRASLGRTNVTLDDFLQFQEGDIIQLPKKEGEDIEIYVGEQQIFKGQPGAFEQNLAVIITGWYEEQGDEQKNA